jgi:hypothetical protein
VEYSAAQLATGGMSITPFDAIGANGGSLTKPTLAVFDASGTLWVATAADRGVGSNSLQGFTPAQLSAGGSPTPHTSIAMPAGSYPYGLAFDNRGSLWITDSNKNSVYAFTSSQLAAGGAQAPSVTLSWSSPNYSASQPLFDPYVTVPAPSASIQRSVLRAGRRR